MTFNEYKYERLDLDAFKSRFTELLEAFKNASSFEEQDEIMANINKERNRVDTMENICFIRNSIDTVDEYYEKEQGFFDENKPLFDEMVTEYYKALVASKFEADLRKKWGDLLFDKAALSIKVFSPEIIEDLQAENKLVTKYRKLLASARILFQGEERTLSQMTPFTKSKDRSVRKSAYEGITGFFSDHESDLDGIYDELVKLRTSIAHKLGYKNYVQLGYDRMLRTDYNAKDVAVYRDQVYKNIVPITTKIIQAQKERLGLDNLYYYDEPFEFNSGNAKPHGDPEWILNHGKTMYSELSPETKEFFEFMTEKELLDLVAKKGKAGGGYCTYIPDYRSPFIFSNFNGTAHDIEVLTHEAGHAFQVYSSRDYEVPEYMWPTYEACEIHSMSMEFFTWPWMELFFEDEVNKFRYSHLSGALTFIPYGVTVDEFQHFVYENPDATPDERKAKWREIEQKYLPHRDYEENEFMDKGTYWFRQSHIFGTPFYYIDYTLAQICALQFFKWMHEDKEEAWNHYVKLCKLGGSDSFVNLVEKAGLKSPFNEDTISSIVGVIDNWLKDFNSKYELV